MLPPGISLHLGRRLRDVYSGAEGHAELRRLRAVHQPLPHLIAGPSSARDHCRRSKREAFAESVFDGLMLIATGLFQVVIADNCALVADAAFSGRPGPTPHHDARRRHAFAWQITPTSAKRHRARKRQLRLHFTELCQPYLALSLSEFETVAHHLSTWLRDYLYIGLGGNRYGEAKTYRNLFLTMLLGGLWHGANWTYVVWGALHGCGLAIERRFFPSRHGDDVASQYGLGMRWFHRILLFQFVCFAWIFFRAPTFGRAFEMLAALGTWTWSSAYGAAILMVAAFGLPLFFIDSWIERARTEYPSFSAHGRRVALACGMLLVTAVVGAADTSAFIYFQF